MFTPEYSPPHFFFLVIQMRDWRRGIRRDSDVGDSEKDVVGAGGEEDAETIAAYFDLHGLSSSTGLIVGNIDHVRTFQPNAFTSFWPIEDGVRMEKKKKPPDRDGVSRRRDDDARPVRALYPFPFRSALFVLFYCHFLTGGCSHTGGGRVSASRVGRAELRRKSTRESGVVHRVPTGAPRALRPCRATGERTIPAAAARSRGGPSEDDVETDGRADVQRVRRDHLLGRWERAGDDVHDHRYGAEGDRVADVRQGALVFHQRRCHPRAPPASPPPQPPHEDPDAAKARGRGWEWECPAQRRPSSRWHRR